MAVIVDRVPFLRSMRGYRVADLGHDAVAGVLITATAIPLGVGFAAAAGLPPISGLYASIAPLAVYGLFGASRHVKIGLDAAAAAMIGAVIVPLATVAGIRDQSMALALATLVSLLTGVILLLAGLLRAGFLADLLSLPLLVGYQAGIGLSVIIGQLATLLGVPAGAGSDLAKLADLVGRLGQSHLLTVGIGVGALLVLLAAQRWAPALPSSLLVLIVGTAACAGLNLADHGLAVIGALPAGLPPIAAPDLSLLREVGGPVLGVAASLALVAASDVVIASRSFAARGRYRVSANADLAGLGLAEIAAGLTGAVPASASFARTAIAERAGSRTQVSAVLGALTMAGVVAWATGLLEQVPLALLAAVCIDACLRLVDLPAFARLWRLRRFDGAIAVGTVALVLATDPLTAIGVAVALTLAAFLWRTVRPNSARLGRRPGIAGWVPMDVFEDAEIEAPDTVVFDWNGPLMFANAQRFEDRLLGLAREPVRLVVVDCSAIYEIDPSAIAVLEDLSRTLTQRRIRLALAAPPPEAMAQLRRADFPATLGEGPHVFADIDTALAAFGKLPEPPGQLTDPDRDGIYEYVRRSKPRR